MASDEKGNSQEFCKDVRCADRWRGTMKSLVCAALLSLAGTAEAFAQATMPEGPTAAEAVMWHPSQKPVWFEPLVPVVQPTQPSVNGRRWTRRVCKLHRGRNAVRNSHRGSCAH
jgi:hypothetical protein